MDFFREAPLAVKVVVGGVAGLAVGYATYRLGRWYFSGPPPPSAPQEPLAGPSGLCQCSGPVNLRYVDSDSD